MPDKELLPVPTFSTSQYRHRTTAPNNVIFGVIFVNLYTADEINVVQVKLACVGLQVA